MMHSTILTNLNTLIQLPEITEEHMYIHNPKGCDGCFQFLTPMSQIRGTYLDECHFFALSPLHNVYPLVK
jgi:hypothetical protein